MSLPLLLLFFPGKFFLHRVDTGGDGVFEGIGRALDHNTSANLWNMDLRTLSISFKSQDNLSDCLGTCKEFGQPVNFLLYECDKFLIGIELQ